jgi:hypothetical protein
MSNTFILLLAAAVGLIASILIHQWQEIRQLRQERSLGLPQASKGQQSSNGLDPLFGSAPFPTCIASKQGKILWGNSLFWKLADTSTLHTLSDLDAQWGSRLSKISSGQAHHLHLSIRASREAVHERRLFTVLTWGYVSKHTDATVFAFFEQTAPRERRLQTAAFEHQLIDYISQLSRTLGHVAQDGRQIPQDELRKQALEAQSLTEYLQLIHQPLRRQLAHERVDISAIWREVSTALQSKVRSKHIHVTSTLPHTREAFGNSQEYSLALRLLMETIVELTPAHYDLRVDSHKNGHTLTLTLTVPDLFLSADTVRHLMHFSYNDATPHITKLKAALAHQILVKYHGALHVSSEKHGGTIFELRLAGTEK